MDHGLQRPLPGSLLKGPPGAAVAPIPLASRYPTSGATSLILRCIALAIPDPVDIITPVHTLSNSSTTRPGTYPSSTTILTIETDDNTLERMRAKPIAPDRPTSLLHL